MSVSSRYPKRKREKRSFTEVPGTHEPGNKAVKAAKCLLLCRNRRQGLLSMLQIDVVVAIAKFVWIDQFLIGGEYHRKMLESVVWKREMWKYGGAQAEAYCRDFTLLGRVSEKHRKEAGKFTEAEIYAWNKTNLYIDGLKQKISMLASSYKAENLVRVERYYRESRMITERVNDHKMASRKAMHDCEYFASYDERERLYEDECEVIREEIFLMENGYQKTVLTEGPSDNPPDIPFQEAEEESWNE